MAKSRKARKSKKPAVVKIKQEIKKEVIQYVSQKQTRSSKKVGVIGLGHLGNLIVVDLVNAGHEICVFCSNEEEKMTFKALAIEVMENPCDVFMSSSIIFTYLPNDAEIQKIIFGSQGIAQISPELLRGKGYVEMTLTDIETSKNNEKMFTDVGMNYLQMQVQAAWSIDDSKDTRRFALMASGDKKVFEDCQPYFAAIAVQSFYMNKTGDSLKVNLTLQMLKAVQFAGLAEAMNLARAAGLPMDVFTTVLKSTDLASKFMNKHAIKFSESQALTNEPSLKRLRHELALAIDMANQSNSPSSMFAITNEMIKEMCRYEKTDMDAIVYVG